MTSKTVFPCTFDPEADAADIQTVPQSDMVTVARTEEASDGIMLDFAEDGHLLGIEILDVKLRLPAPAGRRLHQAAE